MDGLPSVKPTHMLGHVARDVYGRPSAPNMRRGLLLGTAYGSVGRTPPILYLRTRAAWPGVQGR
eukprot:scaffold1382_cov429-Prasinococcus_capsulatus_cf.AAC.10